MPDKKTKKDLRQRGSNLLIIIGIILLLIFIVYSIIFTPWKALFIRWELTNPNLPKDPSPLPAFLGQFSDEPDITSNNLTALPSQPASVLTRPAMRLKSMGIIKIPLLSVSEYIVEGYEDELLYGVGHTPGTALPGQEGNCFLSGHRNYIRMRPFRYLDWLKEDDYVYILDEKYIYTYQVYDSFVVESDAVWVMLPVEGESHALTLMTCTPVFGLENRLIVRCRLINTSPN